mgnify:CR=1 FL=1
MSNKKFYMTTAIAYTSGKPHIGNTYEFVLADAIASAYETVKTVNFANAYYRNDIGKKAMEV